MRVCVLFVVCMHAVSVCYVCCVCLYDMYGDAYAYILCLHYIYMCVCMMYVYMLCVRCSGMIYKCCM